MTSKEKTSLDEKIIFQKIKPISKTEIEVNGIKTDDWNMKLLMPGDVREAIQDILERIEDLNETLRKDNTIWRISQDELNDLWEEKAKEIIKQEVGTLADNEEDLK